MADGASALGEASVRGIGRMVLRASASVASRILARTKNIKISKNYTLE